MLLVFQATQLARGLSQYGTSNGIHYMFAWRIRNPVTKGLI